MSTVAKEMKLIEERRDKIIERVSRLKSIREDVVYFNRYSGDMITFLEMASESVEGRRRSNWYGEVIKVSEIESGDELLETKKKLLYPGQVILYNPESAYSLNIADYPEIWILHVDSVICGDTGFDYYKTKESLLQKRNDIVADQNRRSYERKKQIDEAIKLRKQLSSKVQ